MKANFSIAVLVLANLVPIIGVLFYQWDAVLILALFWIENLIIGAFNVLKMWSLIVFKKQIGGLFISLFFIFHYGAFCAVHGTLLWDILGLGDLPLQSHFLSNAQGFGALFGEGVTVLMSFIDRFNTSIYLALSALVLSHLVSFIEYFILQSNIHTLKVNDLMGKPYGQIVVMHVGLLLGAFAVQQFGSPIWLLLVIVTFKLLIDIRQHRRRHTVAETAIEIKE